MTQLTIGEGTQVTLHFSLKLEGGELVDSTREKEPAQFVVGDGNLLDGFEKVLFGLSAGAQQTFVVPPEQGFGQPNPQNQQTFKRSEFADDMKLEKGLVLSFADAQNAELPGVIAAIGDETVTVDFNHPLAGKDIHFEVEILDVQPATTH